MNYFLSLMDGNSIIFEHTLIVFFPFCFRWKNLLFLFYWYYVLPLQLQACIYKKTKNVIGTVSKSIKNVYSLQRAKVQQVVIFVRSTTENAF